MMRGSCAAISIERGKVEVGLTPNKAISKPQCIPVVKMTAHRFSSRVSSIYIRTYTSQHRTALQ